MSDSIHTHINRDGTRIGGADVFDAQIARKADRHIARFRSGGTCTCWNLCQGWECFSCPAKVRIEQVFDRPKARNTFMHPPVNDRWVLAHAAFLFAACGARRAGANFEDRQMFWTGTAGFGVDGITANAAVEVAHTRS